MARLASSVLALAIGCGPGCASARPRPREQVPATPRPAAETQPIVLRAERLSAFSTVQIIKKDCVLFVISPPTDGVTMQLSINGNPWTDRGEARAGDTVYLGFLDVLGAGAHWFDVVEVHPDHVLMRENTSFYNIMPEEHRLLAIRPYGQAR